MLVDHHMDLVTYVCDRMVVLDFGRVIASGVPPEVRQDPRVLEAYLGSRRPSDPVATRRTPRQPMLAIEDLTTDYGPVRAVDHVSLQVPPGSVTAVLGANGAGKTLAAADDHRPGTPQRGARDARRRGDHRSAGRGHRAPRASPTSPRDAA